MTTSTSKINRSAEATELTTADLDPVSGGSFQAHLQIEGHKQGKFNFDGDQNPVVTAVTGVASALVGLVQ